MTEEPFLSRWLRRKSEAKGAAPLDRPPEPAESVGPGLPMEGEPTQADLANAEAAAVEPEPLPPVESLTPDSDFAAFMRPDVDPSLKRQAFKKLMEDPRFNVMDGLDVYIDDYSKADPIPEGWLEKMTQMRYLGIFKEDAEDEEVAEGAEVAEGTAKAEAESPPEAMQELPAAFPARAIPPDTSVEEILPAEVGKSEGMKGGS
ncbi:MAG TPA: DUF3306 domain-containing protein [Usitatibacter sp.]